LSVDDGSDLLNLGRDRLGSITAETDDTEALAPSRAFQPYGGTTAASGSFTSSLGFIGGRLDPDTDWYTLGQRTSIRSPRALPTSTATPMPAATPPPSWIEPG